LKKIILLIGIALLLSIVLISGCALQSSNMQSATGGGGKTTNDAEGIPTPQAPGTESDADIPNLPI